MSFNTLHSICAVLCFVATSAYPQGNGGQTNNAKFDRSMAKLHCLQASVSASAAMIIRRMDASNMRKTRAATAASSAGEWSEEPFVKTSERYLVEAYEFPVEPNRDRQVEAFALIALNNCMAAKGYAQEQ